MKTDVSFLRVTQKLIIRAHRAHREMDCPRWTQFLGPYYGIDHVHEASEDEKSHKCSRMCAVPSMYTRDNEYLRQRFVDKFVKLRGIRMDTNGEPSSPTGTIARATGVVDMFLLSKPNAMDEFNMVLNGMADKIDAAIGGPWTLCSANVSVLENLLDKTVELKIVVEYK